MNHLTSICFLRSDPIFYPANSKSKNGRAVAILSPTEPMSMKSGRINREAPRPKIYAVAEGGSDVCKVMLTAKKGDFVNVFGELYLDSFAIPDGGYGTRIIVKVYHIVVKPNKKMQELCARNDADAEKQIAEIINEMNMNEIPLDPIEETL